MYELRRVLSVPARRADALVGDLPSLAQQRGLCAGEGFFVPRRSEEEERFEAHPCVVGDGIKNGGLPDCLSVRRTGMMREQSPTPHGDKTRRRGQSPRDAPPCKKSNCITARKRGKAKRGRQLNPPPAVGGERNRTAQPCGDFLFPYEKEGGGGAPAARVVERGNFCQVVKRKRAKL